MYSEGIILDTTELDKLLWDLENTLLGYPPFLFGFMFWFTKTCVKYSLEDGEEKYYILMRLEKVKTRKKELEKLYQEEKKNYE